MSEDAEGIYKCIAKNDHGKEEKLFNLHLGYLPEPPLEIELVKNTTSSLSLNVTLPYYEIIDEEDMSPIILVIQYRANSEKEWKEQQFNISEGNVIQFGNLTIIYGVSYCKFFI